MILIYPPVAKPSEPPAGLAKLSGLLSRYGITHTLLDANLEGLLAHANIPQTYTDRWSVRAFRDVSKNLASLNDQRTYRHLDRYKRAVIDLNRVLEMSIKGNGVALGLANYQDPTLSPLRSRDLIRAAEEPERNPFYPYFRRRLLSLLEKEQPAHVGFSLNFLSQALCTFAMIGFLRQLCPELTLLLGGGLVTSWLRNPGWRNPFRGLVDHLIAGPGEAQLLSILDVHGTQGDHVTPNFDLLPIQDYLSPGFILPYSGSSGCYWNKCSFCPEKAEANPYVQVPIDYLINDLKNLITKTEPVLIHLLDNSMSPELLKGLAENPPGVPWYGFARISRHLTDLDFCTALKDAGCVMLQLGAESGDQGVLDGMHKGILVSTATSALQTLKRAGIAAYVYLLFGTPPETITEARKTLEFTVEHRDAIGFLNLALFNMPVRGSLTAELETSGFYEGDLSLYTDFSHPHAWNRREVRHFLKYEFKKHPAISPILTRDPPFFTSNHAPFFVL
jgi:radical SAM superfamily enzyme YgiQ (UPF0313 family)